jgi:TorA maturation chaperone TorD
MNTAVMELAAEEQQRAILYGLLANLFYDVPSASLLEMLGLPERNALCTPHSRLAKCWQRVRETAALSDVDAVAEEFRRLFIGAGCGGEIVPYGSWHLTGFLMEEPLAHLREDLAALGFGRRTGVREPEDHIAALCETMRLLIEENMPLERQGSFFRSHLAPWGINFAAQLARAPSARFYRPVAELARTFFEIEGQAFDIQDSP